MNKRGCYRPVSKEPHLYACHSPSSQTPIKWNNPSVQILICSVWKLDAFLLEIYKLSWFAKAPKHINRRSYLKLILVRTCLLPHVHYDIIIDSLETWYLLPSLGLHTAFWIPNWNCFWGSKMTLSWASTDQSPIPQPTHLVQMLRRKHSDLTNAH